MNSTAVSDYDNVNCKEDASKSSIYRTLNDLLSLNSDTVLKIFCPLCTNSFEFKFSLFEHLKTFHNNFLNQAGNRSLKFKECPFCSAKFYGKHLTVKHVLLHHTKVVKELFVHKTKSKCIFCGGRLNKRDCTSVAKHIEELHFLEFEEEFKRMFSCENVLEMTISEFINSSIEDGNSSSDSDKWEDVCMDISNKGNKSQSIGKDFPEASKLNCYDFTDLKEQLQSIKDSPSVKKSILKDSKNVTPQKSVRRVLRFDLPNSSENKENSVLLQNLETFKKINMNEHKLLCNGNPDDSFQIKFDSSENLCGEPQHSSTPNTMKISGKHESRKQKIKPSFKSYLVSKTPGFEFQCGKCRKLFKENLDLVCHIKNNHNKFSFNVLQPCYRCAICNARFYKNYYLRKHHSLHKPY